MIYLPHRRKHFRWDLSGNTVAQYLCNDNAASTVVTDVEGTNGTASANTDQLSVAGKINLAFDYTAGNSEYFNSNQTFQATFQSPFTFPCWLKPDDGQPAIHNAICGAYNAALEDWIEFLVITTGDIQFRYRANGNDATARTNVAVFPDGATSWTHVLVTVDATSIKIYINGVVVALDVGFPGSMAGVVMGDFAIVDNLFIGARNNFGGGADRYFDGPMDDVRIIDKVTTQTEINGIVNGGAGTEAQSG